MTPDQKRFKMILQELEDEGKIPIEFTRRRRKKHFSFIKFISIIVVIVLIGYSFSIDQWIPGIFNESIGSYNISSQVRYDTNPLTSALVQSQHKAIRDYLNTGKMLNERSTLILKEVYKRTGDGAKYSEENIHNDLKELEILKERLTESQFSQYRLNDIYLKIISLTEEMLNNVHGSNKHLKSLREEYYSNTNEISEAMIEILEDNNIRYEIDSERTITYYLMQPEFNAADKDSPKLSLNHLDIPYKGDEVLDIPPEELTYKDITYKWEYPLGKRTWDYSLKLPIETVNHYKSIDRNDIDGYSYYVTHEADDEYLSALANVFKTTGKEENLSEFETINLAVSFVQSLKYVPDDIGTGYDEYPKFPLETLYDEGGDCEDSSILLASLLRELGYGTVLVLFDNHMGVGAIASETANFTYEGKHYHYIETTGPGWAIGQLPIEFKGKPITVLPVNK